MKLNFSSSEQGGERLRSVPATSLVVGTFSSLEEVAVGVASDTLSQASCGKVPVSHASNWKEDASEPTVLSPADELLRAVDRVLSLGMSPDLLTAFVAKRVGMVSVASESGSSISGSTRSSARRAAKERRNREQAVAVHAATVQEGFAYGALFKPASAVEIMRQLGPKPRMAALVKQPVKVFRPCVVKGDGPAIGVAESECWFGVGPMVGDGAVSTFLDYVGSFARISAALVHSSWLPKLSRAKSVAVNMVLVAGPALGWSVLEAAEFDGACYLSFFDVSVRAAKYMEFGSFPFLKVLVWARYDHDVRLCLASPGCWHVTEDKERSVLWSEVVAAYRNRTSLVCGGEVYTYVQLGQHRVGGKSLESGATTLVDDEASERLEFSQYVNDRMVSGEGYGTTDLLLYHYGQSSLPWEPGCEVSISGYVFAESFSAGSSLFRFHAGRRVLVVRVPGECSCVVEGVEFLRGPTKWLVVREGVDLHVTSASKLYVKVLSRNAWRTFSGREHAVSHIGRCHRVSYVADVKIAVCLPRFPAEDFEPSPCKVLHDLNDPWLAENKLRYAARKKNRVASPFSWSSVSVEAFGASSGDTLFLFDLVKLPVGSSIVLHSFDPFNHTFNYRSQTFGLGVEMEVCGVEDTYCFDGGGPDVDDEYVSGEEYMLE